MAERLGRKATDADYGMGEHSIDCTELGMLDEEEITARLTRVFEAPGYSPPRLPAVATELLTLSQQPDVAFDAVEALLEQDAMLAGEVLSVARSAFYARVGQVRSLREALVRLGLQKLKDMVFQAAMNMRVFRSKAYGECMERVRQHSTATAHLCRIVSRYTPMPEDHAFLCGLLHDVGVAGMLLVLGDVPRGKKPPDISMLWSSIDSAHARAGARMVELWGLSQEISVAVGAHHQVRIDGFDHPVAAIVCQAEALSAELDLGLVPGKAAGAEGAALIRAGLATHGRVDRSQEPSLERAQQSLGLTEEVMESLRADAREWAETLTAAAAR